MGFATNSPIATRLAIYDLSAAITLTNEDTGKVFLLDAAGATITIPAAHADNRGVWYRFVVNVKVTTDWLVTSGAADIHVHISSGGAAEGDTLSAGSADTTIVFQNDVADEGDWAEYVSDGVNWYVTGDAHATANITAS